MSKELEALHTIAFNTQFIAGMNFGNELRTIEKALQRLDAIDNAKPSEALECLEKIVDKGRINNGNCCHWRECLSKNKCNFNNDNLMCPDYKRANTIKQALLKAQEQDFNYNKIVIPFLNELAIILGINDIDEMLDKIKEQKKALEIMFKKTVGIFQLSCCKNVDEYNDLKFNDFEKLTQEEFELLKRYFDEQD